MSSFTLRKGEKLCSRTAVQRLFGNEGKSLMAYPVRAVYRLRPAGGHPVQFLITIPKKRIRHAVDRVTLRRRVREAYRLHRHAVLDDALRHSGQGVDIALVWVANDMAPSSVIVPRVTALLTRIADAACPPPPQEGEEA